MRLQSPTQLSDFHFTSLRIDRLDLLAAQVTLKSLLQNHSSKAPILQRSVLCMVFNA